MVRPDEELTAPKADLKVCRDAFNDGTDRAIAGLNKVITAGPSVLRRIEPIPAASHSIHTSKHLRTITLTPNFLVLRRVLTQRVMADARPIDA